MQNSDSLNGDKILDMLDSAQGQYDLTRELDKMKRIAADHDADPIERQEAYEDIIDSEVGDTSFVRARNIERESSLRQVFLKFEGNNPTGTQKDRIAFAQALDALRRDYDTLTMATCGNYGTACAFAASLAGLRCQIFLPGQFHTRRIKEMEQFGAEIIRVEGDYETAVRLSQEHAAKNEVYDANPGGVNTMLQLRAYGEIAYEIYDELRDAPAAVAIPVSNGTTLAGIYKGFLSLYRRGKTSRMPRIIAGSSWNKNPIVQAVLKKLDTCEDLLPGRIRETHVNEPLINWHSIDGDQALWAVRESNGWAGHASDKSLLAWARKLREKEGLHVLPASTAGLHAMLDRHQKEPLNNDRYVVVLTGRRD